MFKKNLSVVNYQRCCVRWSTSVSASSSSSHTRSQYPQAF